MIVISKCIQHHSQIPAISVRQKQKQNKGDKTWKGRNTLSFLQIIIYVEYLKVSTEKLLGLIRI